MLCIGFICLKPDPKRCKLHGTSSTWPLEDQEFHMTFSFSDSHSYPETTPKTLFPVAQQEHSSIQQHSTMAQWFPTISCRTTFLFCPKVLRHLGNIDLTAAEILCYPYKVHTRSLRDLKVGRKRAKRRKKTSFSFSTLLFYYLLLLYSLSESSYWETISTSESISKKYVSKTGVTTRQKLCQKQLLQKEWHDMDMSNTWYDMSMTWTFGCVWKCCVPLNLMVLLIIIPMKNGYCISLGRLTQHFQTKQFMNIPAAQVAPWRRVTEAILRGTSQSEKVPYPATELPGGGIPELLRPFSGAGTMVQLRQKLGEIQKLLQKKLDLLSFFDSWWFFRFWIKSDKIEKLPKKNLSFFVVFFRFVFVLFSFFSDLFSCVFFFFSILFRIISNRKTFSIYVRIIFETQKQCSIHFRIMFELKKNFGIIFESEAHFDFVFAITGAIATVIFATLAGFVATS